MTSSNANRMSTVFDLSLRQHLAEAGQIAAEELSRKHEIFAQQIETLENPMVVGKQRVLAGEADLLEALRRRRYNHRVAEGVEVAEIDALAVGEQLLVERDRIRFRADEIQRQIGGAAAGEQHFRLLERLGLAGLVLRAGGGAVRQGEPHPGQHIDADRKAERLQRRRRGEILGADKLERPDDDVAAQPIAAGDLAVELAEGGIQIGAARDGAAVAQRLVAEGRERP